jgi:glycosyltransferase involved in cell wall biosynthesis
MLTTSPADTMPRKRVLMLAFHFPPLAGSSGIQRTLRFVQHLPAHGWEPIVLSAHPRAYAQTASDLLAEVPPGTIVERAFALDTARHLSLAGRYPGFLGRPDRWRTWALGAIPAGLRLIRKYRPDVIWSTYPIASAHMIAHRLQRLSGVPLVADFRDPMAQDGYPEDPRTWQAYRKIEEDIARHASRLVFVTPSARALYRERYASLGEDRFVLVENGYDEESFAAAETSLDRTPLNPGRFTLLHSGIVYPSERDPTALFAALARLHQDARLRDTPLRVRFRAPVHEDLLRRLAADSRIEASIEILPPLPYQEALKEMLRADGLMVMQAANCNEQVPAKLYEYFRARRPILGLADPAGDTAKVMADAGVEDVAPLEDAAAIEGVLLRYLQRSWNGTSYGRKGPPLETMSRRGRAQQLATLLDETRAAHLARRP